MYTTSSYVNHRQWTTVCSNLESDAIEEVTQQSIIDKNLNAFIGWLLFNIGRIGSNGNRQLFFITYTCTFFGLSRDGIEALYRYGYGVSLTTYDSFRIDAEYKAKDECR